MTDALIVKAKVLKGRVRNAMIRLKKRANWFDISLNLDTSDCVDREVLFKDTQSPNVAHMGRYVPTDFTQIRDSLGWLIAHDRTVLDQSFIDFGCGKGRVLIAAERMGFKKIIGVEFAQSMCDVCRDNLKKAGSRAVQVVRADAAQYPITGNVKTFYFCNPFEYPLFEKVLANIRAFLKTAPYAGYVIYIDPRKFGQLDPAGYELMFHYDGPGTPFHIYKVII